jgi:hypothetical protein
MKHPKYNYRSENLFLIYEFLSEGPKGIVKKMVEYTETATENVYNLGFGDYEEKTGEINDLSVSNNGDSLKVLATEASTVYAFTEKYPKAWILATGSTAVRTRLYRMGITNNLAVHERRTLGRIYSWGGLWAFLLTKKENKFFI